MLKIKDNVDLNILIEKYGFKPRYDVNTGEIIELYRINGHYGGEKEIRRPTATITLKENLNSNKKKLNWFTIFSHSKKICPRFYNLKLDVEDYEILYDLIKADLVEKVEDK